MSRDAREILAALSGDDVTLSGMDALAAYARARGLNQGHATVGLNELIGLGPNLPGGDAEERKVAARWDDLLRTAWKAANGLPNPTAPPSGSVTVLPFREAFLSAPAYGAVITAEDVDASPRLRLPDGPNQLVLSFDDLDEDDGITPVATRGHVEQALSFSKDHADSPLLVHCQAGQCRSPGIALAILADRLGPGREQEAVAHLLAIRPTSAVNLLVLAHADRILDRHGSLEAAWHAYEEGREDLARLRFLKAVAHERFRRHDTVPLDVDRR